MNEHQARLEREKRTEYLNALPRINLWRAFGAGLVVPFPTKLAICNQVGGHANLPQIVEGFYVPINNFAGESGSAVDLQNELDNWFVHGPKYKGWCDRGIDDEDADFLDALMLKCNCCMTIKVNRAELKACTEAWIPVTVAHQKEYLLKDLEFCEAILTWSNSD